MPVWTMRNIHADRFASKFAKAMAVLDIANHSWTRKGYMLS